MSKFCATYRPHPWALVEDLDGDAEDDTDVDGPVASQGILAAKA